MGIFITLEPPSKDMTTEAVTAGYYQQPGWDKPYPKIQIMTVAELLRGIKVQMPSMHTAIPTTFKPAPRIKANGEQQGFNL
jgi:site-specific DNA-methyltransferase (adenine-specific)